MLTAYRNGIIIGIARPQIVLSGYALFLLGLGDKSSELTEKELLDQESVDALSDG